MSNFAAESHSLRTFKERRAATTGTNFSRWLKADKTIDEIYVDLCNGATKSDVIQKMTEGLYSNQDGKGIKERTALEYLKAAQLRMAYDFESQAEEMRADLYNKLISVYADAVKSNDRYNAIQAVNTIMKLTGVALDKPQNNIQVNANKEGIQISFGFKKDEETDGNSI